MENYLGVSIVNKSISPDSGEVGAITDKFFIEADRDYTLQWKHINYTDNIRMDAMYIIKDNGERDKIRDIYLDNFTVIHDISETVKERLCYITFNVPYSGFVSIQIGRKQTLADRENYKVFDMREVLVEFGNSVNTWRPKETDYSKVLYETSSKIKILEDRINMSVTKEYFNDLNQKIGSALSKIDMQANQIENTVKVNNLTSYLRQDAEAIMIGFNGISDSISMTRKGIRVWHEGKGYTLMGHEEIYQTDNTAGRKLISLKDGGFRVYKNDTDNSYVGGIISGAKMLNGGTKGFGITIANGYRSWYTSIGHNPDVYDPEDESITGYQSFLDIVFTQHYNQDGEFMRVGTHILNGGLDLHNHNIFNAGIIWFDPSDYDAIYKDGTSMIVQCEDVIKLIRNSSKGEQREGVVIDFPGNEIKFNMDMNGQGYTMYNTIWQGTYTQPTRNIIFSNTHEENLIDNVEVVNVKDGKLGLIKSSTTLETRNKQEETFEYEQLIYSLIKEVKELKHKVDLLELNNV